MSDAEVFDDGSERTPKMVQGTLARGPDGSLYFVPDLIMAHFRVVDEGDRERLTSAMDGLGGEMHSYLETRHVVAPIANLIFACLGMEAE